MEPSGEPFNEISLDPITERPRNPMINAGAITATSLVTGATADERFERIRSFYSRFAGRELTLDEAMFASEDRTGHRNRAIGYMLRSFGILEEDPQVTLDVYFRQCSIEVDCRDLSLMAATLADSGVQPVSGERVLESRAHRAGAQRDDHLRHVQRGGGLGHRGRVCPPRVASVAAFSPCCRVRSGSPSSLPGWTSTATACAGSRLADASRGIWSCTSCT